MQIAHTLLAEATRKLIELSNHPDWAVQLPARCPPVLWFGNAVTKKRKVLTLGANPSRKEFLTDSAIRALAGVRQTSDQSVLAYREPPETRFRVLAPNEKLDHIL